MKSSVLIVDDDIVAAERVTDILESRGYDARTAHDAESALSSIRASRPAIVLADLGVPQGNELCRLVRQASDVPLIAMSRKPDVRLEIAALDSGADDYLEKPLDADRLLARVRARLRQKGEASETSALTIGEFQVDFEQHRVCVKGRTVRLTPKEFDLLVFMARRPNRVLPHKFLLAAVWGESAEEQAEYLRVFISQLRKKLEAEPSNPRYLLTEPWVGYRFNPGGVTSAAN